MKKSAKKITGIYTVLGFLYLSYVSVYLSSYLFIVCYVYMDTLTCPGMYVEVRGRGQRSVLSFPHMGHQDQTLKLSGLVASTFIP